MSEMLIVVIIAIGGMFLLLTLGAEIFVTIAIPTAIVLMFFLHQSLDIFASSAWYTLNSFSLSAVPLFTFMGAMFASSGAISNIFKGADKLLSFLPGGIAATGLGASAIFGAISGSSIAAVAAFGTSVLPEMEKLKYDPKLALGAICMGGTLSVLIPPSVVLIVYGGYQGISIPRLFAGAIVPGLILTILYLLTVIAMVKINPGLVPKPIKYSWKEKLSGIKDILPAAFIICLVLGMIFAGVMTPTESAGIGAVLSMLLALAYRRLNFTTVKQAAMTAFKLTAMVSIIIAVVKPFGYTLQFVGATDVVSNFMLGLPFGKYGILVILFILYMILGCFMHGTSVILLSLVFVVPILNTLGLSLVWFGVVVVIVNELALVTPPFGLNLFALYGVVGHKYSILYIARTALPFYPAVIILLVLCVAYPQLILWLPNMLY